jgi:hypothetical protein
VSEEIVAACVRSDEAEAFAIVEPLNSTGILEIKIIALLRSDKNFKEEERIASTAQKRRKMVISNRAS